MIMTTNGMRYYFVCRLGKKARQRILFKALYRQVAYNDYVIISSIEMFLMPVDLMGTVVDTNRLITTMMYDLNKNKHGRNN